MAEPGTRGFGQAVVDACVAALDAWNSHGILLFPIVLWLYILVGMHECMNMCMSMYICMHGYVYEYMFMCMCE